MCSSRSRLITAFALVTSTFAAPSYAQDASAEDKAAARELAVMGIQLAQDGKCDHAMDPLTRAEQLYHAPTILTWIGECEIQMGRLVAGSETLRQVLRETLPADAPSAFVDAQKRAAFLLEVTTPRIAKLTLAIQAESGELTEREQLKVSVDGTPISLALIGVPRPTDPGEHEVLVELAGYEPERKRIVLADGEIQQLNVRLKKPLSSSEVATSSAYDQNPQGENDAASSGYKTLGWALVGGGAGFLAGGGVLGLLALNKKQDLDCPTPATCPLSEESTLKSARLLATLSTVSFGVGGAAALTGLIVLLTGDDEPNTALITTRSGLSLHAEVGYTSLGLSGTF